MAIAVTMPFTSYAQKNRSKRKTKKAKTEMVVKGRYTLQNDRNAKEDNTSGAETSQDKRDTEKVIAEIDKTFSSNINRTDLATSFYKTKSLLENCLSGKQLKHKNNVLNRYYEAFYQASDEENLESAVDCALKYVMLGGTEDEDVMWKFLVEYYATDGDTENTKFLISQIKENSSINNFNYSRIINELEAKYDDVINPKTFEETAFGYWVSIESKWWGKEKSKMNVPNFILQINNLRSDNGCRMESSPIYHYGSKDNYGMLASQSLACDADAKYIHTVFGDEKMKYGNEARAHKQLEENRQWKAKMHGKINSSDGNFGQKLAGSVATELVGGLFDGLAMSGAESSKTGEAFDVELNGLSPNVMSGKISYRKVKIDSYGYNHLQKYYPNLQYTFVKWNPSDSIIFIDENEMPIYVGISSPQLLSEYNAIKNKYNQWKKPQYVIPAIVAIGGSLFCFTCFVKKVFDSCKEKNIDNGTDKRHFKQAFVWLGLACVPPLLMIPLDNHYNKKRKKAFNEINERSMEKMHQKAASLSLKPTYSPDHKAFGMNVNLTF